MKNTKCSICGNTKKFLAVHSYDKPDKYEAWVGIDDVKRSWVRCMNCGFYIHLRNYDLAELEKIYKKGYRDKEFRGETIEDAFNRILAVKDSENEQRYYWFTSKIPYVRNRKILDIGSGIGVWPKILSGAQYDVTCVEENETSIDFIYEQLGVPCFNELDSVTDDFDAVTLIHVLEHIECPKNFLSRVKHRLRKGGSLFVEVPDAIEFSYLPKEHDEFNSCHVAFYSMASLFRMIESAGFTVVDIHLEKTKERNLSRIMCLAIN